MRRRRRGAEWARRTGRPDPGYFEYAVRTAVKEGIWLLTARHEPGSRKDICLFACRRGGSTWVMELIAANRRVRPLDEPFGPGSGTSAQVLHMPKYEAGHVVHLADAEEERAFRAYVDLLFAGRAAVNTPWWFWRKGFTFRSERLVLKILEAKALIDWFDRNYDVEIVLLSRHPIPQALSLIRNQWRSAARVYLKDPWFREQLGADLVEYSQRVLRDGSQLEQQVLGWALEQYVPLTLIARRPAWTYVSYEECVLSPEETLDRLSARLELPDAELMRRRALIPSRSSNKSRAFTREQIRRGESEAALRGWRREITPDRERAALEILGTLGIPLYHPGSDLPRPWWDASPRH